MTDELTRKLYSTTDAMAWAKEWCRIARELVSEPSTWNDPDALIDAGWMVGWFANAMQIAENHAYRRAWESLRPMVNALALELPAPVWDDINRRIREVLGQFSPEIEEMLR